MSIIKLLANDNNTITYRKELNAITGSVTATILLQQLIYWFNKNDYKPFYKFIEPCNNEKYIDGDSWTEELGFTKKEFSSAYKKLENLGIVFKKTNMSRVTYYSLDLENLSKLLNGIYVSDKSALTKEQKGTYISDKRELMEVTKGNLDYSKSFDTETTTETTTDIINPPIPPCEKNQQVQDAEIITTQLEDFLSKSKIKKQVIAKLSEHKNINLESFGEWMQYKKYKKIQPITKTLNFLSQYDQNTQKKIIDNSIMNGYAGIFPPKQTSELQLQELNTDINIWDEIAKNSQQECEWIEHD